MKTEVPTNGERKVHREHRRAATTQDYEQNGSLGIGGEDGRSGKDTKKRSLFRRPAVIVVAAALQSQESLMARLRCFIRLLTNPPTTRLLMRTSV